MGLLKEILDWSGELPAWQSDAVARLLAQQTLSSEDLDDLVALLKAGQGIPDAKGRVAKKLTADQIPAPVKNSELVELLAIKNLKNVNAIAESQRLPIGQVGLTVIYGDNGSGKSGYSRVLKRACRARDQGETIYPNANRPAGSTCTAEADFEISINNVPKEVHWVNGVTAPAELSALAIFDSRCARAYLDTENDFSYVPYGLDVFEGLARACKQIKSIIETESAQSAPDLAAFAHLQGETAVGKLVSSLSAKTPPTKVEMLATLSPDDKARHAELDKSLKENNPQEKARLLRIRARRIAGIAANVINKWAQVDQSVVNKLRDLTNAARIAQEAAAIAARKFKETDNLLSGTGGEAWRVLYDAACRFATEAYPDKKFPNLGAASLCPLCQQPLADGADRLLRFESFIQQEAEKESQAKRAALDAEFKPFGLQTISLNLDDVTYGEIEGIDAQLAVDTRTFEQALIARHESIKAAVLSNKWGAFENELIIPASRLQEVTEKLNAEAMTLEQATDETARHKLQLEFNELDARDRLSKIKVAVLTALAKLCHQAKLTKCLSELKTNAISLKASELAEKVVSKGLATALNSEFKALGVGSLSVSLQSRTDKGKALHKLKLELPQSRSPADILSEGEQRAIAIGSFLAEVGLNGGKGGIVFDDPVSSLDHRRRERVAHRLVAEAKNRQVIVFTHDIYFLCLLADEAKTSGVQIATQSLIRNATGFGVADPELPFVGKTVSKRIGALKAQQQVIEKLFKDGNEQEYRRQTVDAYFRMRMTWERAVEEVLLRDVIMRFRKGIETQKLSGVLVEDTDYMQVNEGMKKCSNYAHDKALLGGVAVPEPDELLSDIQKLEGWRSLVEDRSKTVAARRKK